MPLWGVILIAVFVGSSVFGLAVGRMARKADEQETRRWEAELKRMERIPDEKA